MARFLGDVSGRTSVPYTDNAVNTACSNLCSYVNTDKLSCTGNGSAVAGIVTSLTAGSGISVNQSTGAVTISASAGAGAAPTVLYACNGCWGGSACIPVSSRGVYSHYEMFGQVGYWSYYCSQAAFAFAGACGGSCSDNLQASYCCAHCTCGWIGAYKCNYGTDSYTCAGAIAWPFGCSSSCSTACSINGWNFHVALTPDNACCGSQRGFHYCFSTTHSGGAEWCCMGVRNAGQGVSCCGGHPACLKGVCFSTAGGTNPMSCPANIVIVGYGRIIP